MSVRLMAKHRQGNELQTLLEELLKQKQEPENNPAGCK